MARVARPRPWQRGLKLLLAVHPAGIGRHGGDADGGNRGHREARRRHQPAERAAERLDAGNKATLTGREDLQDLAGLARQRPAWAEHPWPSW